jgi:hypothetical protein
MSKRHAKCLLTGQVQRHRKGRTYDRYDVYDVSCSWALAQA